MTETSQDRFHAVALFLTPIVLLVGFVWQPYISNVTDASLIAEKISGNGDRWAWSHIVIILGFALTLLSILALRKLLRSAGEQRWSFWATALAVGGTAFLTAGAGADLMGAAIANSGGDLEAVIKAGQPWMNAVYGVGALLFGLGWLGFAVAFYRTRVLERRLTVAVAAALVVVALAGFIPAGWASWIAALALGVATWTVAQRYWSAASGRSRVAAMPA